MVVLPFAGLLAPVPEPMGAFLGVGLLGAIVVPVTGIALCFPASTRGWGLGLLIGFGVALVVGAGACVMLLAAISGGVGG